MPRHNHVCAPVLSEPALFHNLLQNRARRAKIPALLILSIFAAVLALASAAQAQSPAKTAPPNSPARGPAAGADPKAYAMLKSARDTREAFPSSVQSLSATLRLNDNGAVSEGKFTFDATAVKAGLQISGLDAETQAWLSRSLTSLFAHRHNGNFNDGDGKHPMTFSPPDNSPLGTRVVLHDDADSRYRISNNQVVQVDRKDREGRFVITVLETTPVAGGKNLPREFVVTYFDSNGAIRRTEAFTDKYVQVQGVWLPAMRRIVKAENGAVTVRVLEFSAYQLDRSPTRAAK